MTDRAMNLTPLQASRRLKKLSWLFCLHVQDHMPRPHDGGCFAVAPLVYWQDRKRRLVYTRLEPYLMPDREHPHRPTVLQVVLRRYPVAPVATGLRLRLTDVDLSIWSFELRLLPDQALDFAPWIVKFAEAHDYQARGMFPKPPHPCRFAGRYGRGCREGWTESAWETLDAFRSREGHS